ncbi:FtsK/SpoIIIE domain-containing protein [Actinomadura sp. BRA 177]|uniref:caspase, EACC1-associated type n=1 Tax=Actinomadura sp. BRA 177 TaxID=2745202 RepID=UPI0015962DEB|nr:FtsK/SpoIIIE domain-containing protein [Actinomadura sp. BRA 177]NVI92966.1 caspase family protein [Actinomadura sp. BRA 177]
MSRIALLVATTEYVDPGLRLLRSPAQDARRLAALLEDDSVGYFDQVLVLANEPKAAIEEHIEELFARREPADTVMLYMSCHGIRDKHGRLFFTTVRTRRDLPESTSVSARFVEEQMSRCRAAGKILLLDCCYGGAFVQGMEPFAAPDDGELSAQAAGKGTYVMAASDVLEFAYEGETMTNRSGPFRSVFTEAIIDGLGTGRADADNDGVITAHELFVHIQDQVRQSGVPQTPTEFTSGVQGNIPIARAALWHRTADVRADPFGEESLPLGELLPALVPTDDRGLCAPGWPRNGTFAVPLGRMYDPEHGLRETLTLDLSGGAAHVGIVGGMWSGKTSVLRTLACSLALTHSPVEAQIYALHGEPDGLARLAGLPHVGKVADYSERDGVREIVEGAAALLSRREQVCGMLRIRSPRQFRARRLRGEIPGDKVGEVFLLIDSWPDFEGRYPEFARLCLRIAQLGAYYGMHLAVSSDRWGDIPEELLPHLSNWVELALADPQESRIDAQLAGALPPSGPGFGLSRGGRYVRIAVPATSEGGHGTSEDDSAAVDALVGKIAAAWHGPEIPAMDDHAGPTMLSPGLLDLIGIHDPATFDAPSTWSQRTRGQLLRTAIGVDLLGRPVELDLKETAQGGVGPHGLLIGATGSGKSELLRTLVLGLAVTHSSDVLNFLLIDGKGASTFGGFERLPHVSAVITGLVEELPLIDRLRDVLSAELSRRRQLVQSREHGTQWTYEEARAQGAELEPLPALLIVIDEFSELLSSRPVLADSLEDICRRGRSLGVHLLLASQRFDEATSRRLGIYLTYRIVMRTFSAEESRMMLGVPDAYTLPNQPGRGYLKFGTDTMVGLQAAQVSGGRRP